MVYQNLTWKKEKFKINVVNKDRLKEILGDNIYVKTREENKKLSVICFDLMKYLLFANESVLVLECNFKDYELIELKKLTEELNYQVLSIVFDASNEILHERFLKRLNENRHYVHKSQDFTNIEDFIKTQDELRNAPYFGKVINVNCEDFTYQEDIELFDRINKFLN